MARPRGGLWWAWRVAQLSTTALAAVAAIAVITGFDPGDQLFWLYLLLPMVVSIVAEQLRIAAASTVLDQRELEDAQAVGELPVPEQNDDRRRDRHAGDRDHRARGRGDRVPGAARADDGVAVSALARVVQAGERAAVVQQRPAAVGSPRRAPVTAPIAIVWSPPGSSSRTSQAIQASALVDDRDAVGLACG